MPTVTAHLDPLIAALPAEAQQFVVAALPEARRVLSADALAGWVEGVRRLLDAGSGLGPVVTYLRTVHAVVGETHEGLLPQLVGVCLSIRRQADPRALDAFLGSLPQALRRLKDPAGLHAYLELVDELAGLAPNGITPMFERIGALLEQLSLDGLRRWSLLGVQGHTEDLAAQQAWFRLESADARAILQAAGEGTLFTDVERRLAFYLRALWARQPDLRSATTAAEGKKGRRVSIVDGAIRMPQAFEVFPGQDPVALYRAAAAHAAAHLVYSTQKFPLRALRPIQVALVGLIEDARVEQLAMREMPGLRRLWQPFHVALPSFTVTAVSLMARLSRALIDSDYRDENPFVVKARSMFAENAQRWGDPALSREMGNLLGNDLGQMRVQFNFKTWVIEPLYRDDNLSLWDMGDAGEQRSEDQDVMYQAVNLTQDEGGEKTDLELNDDGGASEDSESVQLEAPAPDEQAAIEAALAQPYHYDEWDYIIGMDRPAWCTLLEKPAPLGRSACHRCSLAPQ